MEEDIPYLNLGQIGFELVIGIQTPPGCRSSHGGHWKDHQVSFSLDGLTNSFVNVEPQYP